MRGRRRRVGAQRRSRIPPSTPTAPIAKHRRRDAQFPCDLRQRPTAARQQGYCLPLELIGKLTTSLAHSTPSRSSSELSKGVHQFAGGSLCLAVEDIDHSRTKTKSLQTNGICERFHRTVLDEFYRVAFRKKIYRTIDELQADLDAWIAEYNEHRPHQGRWCFGKTPMQTFLDTLPLAKEKLMAA